MLGFSLMLTQLLTETRTFEAQAIQVTFFRLLYCSFTVNHTVSASIQACDINDEVV